MVGRVGDDISQVALHLHADADLAGCAEGQRSTSSIHLSLRGEHTCFPLSGVSKRQGCVSHSTPEAEIVAGVFAIRTCGLPALTLWEHLIPSIGQGNDPSG